MDQRSGDNYSLVIVFAIPVIANLLHSITDIFFEEWLKRQLESFLGVTVAEMIERAGAISFQFLAAIAVVWFIYLYIKADSDCQLRSIKADFDHQLEQIRAAQLGESDLKITLGDKPALTFQEDARGQALKSRAYFLQIENGGAKFLQNCQVAFGVKRYFNEPVSAPFDLRRGEHETRPVLHLDCSDGRPFLYALRRNDWKVDSADSTWFPAAGLYEIKVLSAGTAPATIDVDLSETVDGWTLVVRKPA